MRVAIPIWNGRVSPVFDVAGRCALFRVDDGGFRPDGEEDLQATGPHDRLRILVDRRVEVLICGAISRPLQERLERLGLIVIGGIAGPADEILEAYAAGGHVPGRYRVPGGRCRRRHRGGACGSPPPTEMENTS